MAKIKHKKIILKAVRERQLVLYTGTLITLSADCSAEILQAKREYHDIFKVIKARKLQPRILYQAGLSLRFEGEIKSFTDKQKLKEFSTTELN